MKKFKKLMLMCILAGTMMVVTGCGASEQAATENTNTEAAEVKETAETTETSETSKTEEVKEETQGAIEETDNKKIVIEDQLGKTIELDGVPEKVATTIMPFPYIYYAVVGNSDNLIGCNPSSITAYEN